MTRLALICRPGHTWKFEKLCGMLPPDYHADVFLDRDLELSDVARLAEYDIVFFKSKDNRFLEVMQRLEDLRCNCVINSVAAVHLSKNRKLASEKLLEVGVPVPRDYLGPLADVPFARFVIKGEFEDDQMIPIKIATHQEHVALMEQMTPQARVYAQEYIPAEWEYKYYCAAGEVFAFRQRPTLVVADKMSTRESVEMSEELAELTRRTMRATGLDLLGVDFLYGDGIPYLTDINSIQGLQNFQEGRVALLEFFERRLRSV